MSDTQTTSRHAIRWYMGGMGAHFAAFGVQGVLLPWIVAVVLQESAERVGIAQMLSMLPMLLFALFGGVAADRRELRRYLFSLQCAVVVPPLILAAIIMAGGLSYWVMIAYVLALSSLGAFIMPARDSLLTRVAETSLGGEIQRAVTMAMSAQFMAQVAGFLIGGLGMVVGAPPLLLVQAVLSVIAAATTWKLPPAPPAPRDEERPRRALPFADIKEGLDVVWHSERIRPIVLLMFLAGILYIGVFMVLFPILIRDIYGGSSFEIALVNVCFFGGIGTSSYIMSRRPAVKRPGRAIMLAMCTGSTVMVFLHFGPPLWVVNLLALGWGMAGGVSMSLSRAVVQEEAEDSHRARVLSVFQLGTMGGGPLGSLLTGYVIEWLGPLNAVLVPAGFMAILWSAIFFFTPLWSMPAPPRRDGGIRTGAEAPAE